MPAALDRTRAAKKRARAWQVCRGAPGAQASRSPARGLPGARLVRDALPLAGVQQRIGRQLPGRRRAQQRAPQRHPRLCARVGPPCDFAAPKPDNM